MSHELTTHKDGFVEFAYRKTDGMPWHGLGQAMEDTATIDEWRAAAGMDWRIKRSKIRYAVDRTGSPSDFLEIPDQHVLFRSDNKTALGVVSERYQVVQPADVLEFFRDIARTGGLELSAAGTIYGGKRFWATAKIGEAAPVSVRDTIGGYLLISTSADGSMATEVRRTTVRTVCRNTLAIAMAGSPASVKISHRSEFDAEKIKSFMGLNEAAWEAFKHQIVRLANKPVSIEQAEDLTVSLIGGAQDKVRTSAGFNKIIDLFERDAKGGMNDGVYGTAWGWVNSVTEYMDWFARSRSDENRFVSSQWGKNNDMKQQALIMADAI